MKTKVLTLALALFSFISYTQTTSIPDLNFENYLETHDASGNVVPVGDAASMGDGTNGNGLVTTSKISGVTTLNITNLGISNLQGIEDFSALTSLTARFNNLTSVDLSSNTNLTYLDLLENSLSAIDVQFNTALTYLDVGSLDKIGKRNLLTSIDVSMNTALTSLGVAFNDLNTLDVSLNTSLEVLGCAGNSLSNLNLATNTLLTRLTCSRNNITSLNLSNNNNLENITCDNNTGMTTLTLPPSAPLTRLDCYSTNNTGMLTSLNLNSYTNLEVLWCYGNNLAGTLDLSNNVNLQNVDCGNNNLTAINMPNDLDTLFRFLCDNNNLSTLDISNNPYLDRLECFNNPNLSSIVLPTSNKMYILKANNCNLTGDLDFSSLPVLYELELGNNNISSINLSNNFDLFELQIWSNPITNLNLSNNIALYYLDCEDTQLTDLDLTNNTSLNTLWACCSQSASLTNLTLPAAPSLDLVSAWDNNLSSLNYSTQINLTQLDIGLNTFTSVDVSMLDKLNWFYANSNQLTSLNVQNGNNVNLFQMWADDNTSGLCIQVDNIANAESYTIAGDWTRDASASYNTTCSLGIDDFDLASISIYPNPSKNRFYIDLQVDAKYTLSNVFGQQVRKGSLVSGTNELDIETLSSGLYVLNLKTPEGKATKKIIKE